jgi:hypothetical protein
MARVTSDAKRAAYDAKGAADQAAHSRWVEILARLGYAAKGVVYLIIGVLAVKLAMGSGGQTTGSKGAVRTLADEPFGQVMLGLMALGLIGYVVWRFVQSVMDVENEGTDAKGLGMRAFKAGSGVVYGLVALYTIRLLTDGSGGDGGAGGDGAQTLSAQLMQHSWGTALVGLAGLFLIGYAVKQLYNAYKTTFTKKWAMGEMSATERTWAVRAGRLGLAARGVVFSMMGFFFLRAALQSDPSEAKGLEGALTELARSGTGPWALGIVALGLAAYGVYQLVMARYRHMPVGDRGAG